MHKKYSDILSKNIAPYKKYSAYFLRSHLLLMILTQAAVATITLSTFSFFLKFERFYDSSILFDSFYRRLSESKSPDSWTVKKFIKILASSCSLQTVTLSLCLISCTKRTFPKIHQFINMIVMVSEAWGTPLILLYILNSFILCLFGLEALHNYAYRYCEQQIGYRLFLLQLLASTVVFTWYLRGIYVVFTWYLRGIFVVFTWYLRGIYVVSTWYIRN